jgi:L-idonate 5-dehydrogenase
MKALVASHGHMEFRKGLPLPEPGPGQFRIRTLACAICATDLELLRGTPRARPEMILGHEWSGVVDVLGPGVAAALAGRATVGDNVLSDGGEVGFEHPGGFAEFFLTEADKLHPLPPGFPAERAVLAEPLAVAVRGARHAERLAPHGEDPLGEAIIFGDGPVGLLLLAALRAEGPDDGVWLAGGRPARLALARELGAAETINYRESADFAREIETRAGGRFARVFEATGSSLGAKAALQVAAQGGRVVFLGDYQHSQPPVDLQRVVTGELRLAGSNTGQDAWPVAVALLTAPESHLAGIPLAFFPPEDIARALAAAQDRESPALKAVVAWGSD